MYIDKELWNNLKNCIDRMNIDEIDNAIEEIERNCTNEVYVVTNNAIVDHEVDYQIAGVCTTLESAKKLFNQKVEGMKCDSDFENLDAIKITNDIDFNTLNDEWCYEESEYGFNLYQMGEYSSNNFNIQIKKFQLDANLKLDDMELV